MKPLCWTLLGAWSLGMAAACSKAPPADPAPALTHLSVQADWYAEAEQGGYYQALARGFYRTAGLDVAFENGGPGGYPFQKVAGGSADLALGRSDDVILNVSRAHLPVVIVWAYMERDPMAVLVHADSPVRGFADLAGRPVMADPTSAWIPYLKAKYKMDFPIIPLNYGLGAFLADPHYIVQGFATAEPYFIRRQGGQSRTLLIANSGYDPYRVVYANTGFVRAHPAAVRAFVAASRRGWQEYLEGDPGPADRAIRRLNPAMTPDFLAFSRAAARDFVAGDRARGERLGLMTRRRMQEQVDQFVQLGLIPAPIPLDQFVRFDFLPADLAAAP